MRIPRRLLPGLFCVLALGACGEASDAEPASVGSAEGGGKADDLDGVCESADCLEAYEACLGDGADSEPCGSLFARCLVVNEGASLLDCAELNDDDAGVCQGCNEVPECEVVEDGADANLCAGATATCQFESLRQLPGGCSLPDAGTPCDSAACTEQYSECVVEDTVYACKDAHDACLSAESDVLVGQCDPPAVELADPCLSLTCRVKLDVCLETIDREGCTREFAACLAVEESFERSTCDVLPEEAQETCELCMGVDACESVEDGADANACAVAVAQCHWDALAVLPSACGMPPELQ